MQYSRKHILLLSFLLEGCLTLVFFVWAAYRGITFPICPDWNEVTLGLLFCAPLFALNYLLFGPLSERVPFLRSCYEFRDRIVRPLAEALDLWSSAAVSLCAGIGEELFFRGVIQTEFGIFVASVFFSLLHFGPAVRKYVFIATLYVGIGYYFGIICLGNHSLWVPIIAHAAYDFIALLYIQRSSFPSSANIHSSRASYSL
ncbi:MAG: type II CAAX endopeptidase family protein [Bdellovibrionota bacterium]